MSKIEDKFQPGDEVEVIFDGILSKKGSVKPPIKKDEKYKVVRMCRCNCNEQHVDIGIQSDYESISCYVCGEELPLGDSIHWVHSLRLQKVLPEIKKEFSSAPKSIQIL